MIIKAGTGTDAVKPYALQPLSDYEPPDMYVLGWQTSLRNHRARMMGKRDVHKTWADNGNEESRIIVKVLDEVLANIEEEIALMERMK